MGINPLMLAGGLSLHLIGANLMNARSSGFVCAAAILLLSGVPAAKAEFVTVPIGGPVFPSGSGPNVLDFTFTEVPDFDGHKDLTFEGSIQNASLTSGASILFWFDWVDLDSTVHISSPQEFTLGPVGSGANAQFFTGPTALTYSIPYCPPEISVHFVNDTPGVPPGAPPVFVSGTFTYACVPEPVALIIAPLIVLMAPFALRAVKALGATV